MRQLDMELLIARLTDFAKQVSDGLAQADWNRRREIVRPLPGRIEIDNEGIRIA